MSKKNLVLIGICGALSATGVFAASSALASTATLQVTNTGGAADFKFDHNSFTSASGCTLDSTKDATCTAKAGTPNKPVVSTFTFDTSYRVYSTQLPANTKCYTPPQTISQLQVAGGATVPCTVGGTTPPVVQKPVINTKDLDTVINSGDQPYAINLKLANEITPASVFDDPTGVTFKPLNGETALTYDANTHTIAQTGPAPAPGTSVQYELIAQNSAGKDDETITVTYTKQLSPIAPEKAPVINKKDLTQVVKAGDTYLKSLDSDITPSNFFSSAGNNLTFTPLNGETAVTYDPNTHTIKQTGTTPEGKTIQYELAASNNAGKDDQIINVTFLKQVGPTPPPEAPIAISPTSLPLAHVKPGDNYKQTFTVRNIDKPVHLAFLGGVYEPVLPAVTPPCDFHQATGKTTGYETCDVTATIPSKSAGTTYGYEIYLQYKGNSAHTDILKVKVDNPTPPPSSVTVVPNTGVLIYDYINPSDAATLKNTYPLPTDSSGSKLVPQNIYLDSYLGNYGGDATNYDANGSSLKAVASSWLQGKSDIYLGLDTDADAQSIKNIDKLKTVIDAVIKANPEVKGLYLDDEIFDSATDGKNYIKALHAAEPNLTIAVFSGNITKDINPTDSATASSLLWLTSGYDNQMVDDGHTNVSANIDNLMKLIRAQAEKAKSATSTGVNFQVTLPGSGAADGDATAYGADGNPKSNPATTWFGALPVKYTPNLAANNGNVYAQTIASGNAVAQQSMYLCPAYKVYTVLNTPEKTDGSGQAIAPAWDKLRQQIATECGFSFNEKNPLASASAFDDTSKDGAALQQFVSAHFKGFGIYAIRANTSKVITQQPYPLTMLPTDWAAYLKGVWGKV